MTLGGKKGDGDCVVGITHARPNNLANSSPIGHHQGIEKGEATWKAQVRTGPMRGNKAQRR